MSVHQYSGTAPSAPALPIQSPTWWGNQATLAADLSEYGSFVSADSSKHYTLGLGVKGTAALGEALNSTAWYDRCVYYLTGIMNLATPQAGGYLGWKSVPDGNTEQPLYEIYCWRFAPDLLRPLSLLPSYATQYSQIFQFFEHNIWSKWYSRVGPNYHAVMHIGSHWCKIALYFKDNGSTSTIRSQAIGWLDQLDHTGWPHWGGKSIWTQLRAHPANASAWFWPAFFNDSDLPNGSDTSHGEAIYTYVADALRFGYGNWSLASDVPKFLNLKDIVWDVGASKNWNWLIGPPGVSTWAGKYTEMGNFGQFNRGFQTQFEGQTVSHNTEFWGTGAVNAFRLGPPYK